VLKLAFVLSVALFFVWLVAVGVLYGVLDGMGVWDRVNGTYSEFAQNTSAGSSSSPLITASRVFGIAAIIGAINIVLFTALATVGSFVYNVSADLAGGLEITLAERE
jgi:amino acid permease